MATKYECDTCGYSSKNRLHGLGVYRHSDILYSGQYGLALASSAQANAAGSGQTLCLMDIGELCENCLAEVYKGMKAGLDRAKHTSVIKRAANG